MPISEKDLKCPRCSGAMKFRSQIEGRKRAKCLDCGYHPFADLCISSREKRDVKTSIPRSDIEIYPIKTSKGEKPDGCTHYFIGDLQCKDEVDLDYCRWIGEDIARTKPDVIINIGDHADMPSLSSYDRGKASHEGRRVHLDIEAAIKGMNLLLKPLWQIQQKELKKFGEIQYKPRMILTMGNHEERIERHVNANPELVGLLSTDSLRYKEFGWEVYDFLVPAMANGVAYCHFFANPLTGKPYGGTIMNVLKNVGESFSMGHVQKFDLFMRYLPASGKRQMALVNGASYSHDEGYKGPQGNHHFRGIVVKRFVADGGYDLELRSLDTLKMLAD